MSINIIPSREIWPILSVLRFVLASWVLAAHLFNFGATTFLFPLPDRNALVAVYCFLAVSGFSIRHSLEAQPKGYFFRRFLRIAPIHIFSIVLALLVFKFCGPEMRDGFGNLVTKEPKLNWMVALFLGQAVFPFFVVILFPSWSLSVEVIYYILAPIIKFLQAIGAGVLLFTSVAFAIYRPEISSGYLGLDVWGIPAGALAWAWLSGWLAYSCRGSWFLFFSAVAAGIVCIAQDHLLVGTFNYVAWIFVITTLFFGFPYSPGRIVSRVFNTLGELSFPLYLLHYPLLFLILNHPRIPAFAKKNGLVQAVLAMGLAFAAYHLIELPIRRLARSKALRPA